MQRQKNAIYGHTAPAEAKNALSDDDSGGGYLSFSEGYRCHEEEEERRRKRKILILQRFREERLYKLWNPRPFNLGSSITDLNDKPLTI